MTTKQANEILDEVERQLGEEFLRRFHFWLDTTRDDTRKVTAIQVRDRGNGWLVATIPVSETTTAQELFDAIQRLRLIK
jgi:MoxR-like ATPase